MTARDLLARARRRRFVLPSRGVEIAALEWGGDGPLALLHHANGFCKGVWGLVAGALMPRWRVVAIDARGHGDSSKPRGGGAYEWDNFAEDLLEVAAALAAEQGGRPIELGMGHSFGGTAMIGAAARRPELFARLLLLDPVVPPPPHFPSPPQVGSAVRRLIEGAHRRRSHWPSLAAARAWCAGRPFFAAWQPEAIELYLLDGMHRQADGSLHLACPGAIEAAVFAGTEGLDLFPRAARVCAPTLILWAARGDFPRFVHESLAAAMPAARVAAVDTGHLVPMERPDLVAEAAKHFAAGPRK